MQILVVRQVYNAYLFIYSLLEARVKDARKDSYKLLNTRLTLAQHKNLKDALPLRHEKNRAMFRVAWVYF